MSDDDRLDDTQESATPPAARERARPRKTRAAVARRQRQRHGQAPLRHHLVGAGVLLVTVVSGYVMSSVPPSDRPAWITGAPSEAEEPGVISRDVIATYVREAAARYGISENLVYAIIAVESEFDHRAVSRRGARGLMQLMPVTAGDLRVEDVFDPRENIEGGVRHLRRLMDRFDNDLPLVLAAYNAGERAVRRYRGVPPYRETREYIVRVMRRLERAADPSAGRPGRS